MSLPGNNLMGSLPASVSTMTALTYLNLSGNFLYGSVPSGLGAATGLQYVCCASLHHTNMHFR